MRTMPPAKPIPAGTVFGQLTVLRTRVAPEPTVLVRCVCGTEREVGYTGLCGKGRTTTCGGPAHQTGAQNGRHRHGHATAGAPSRTYMIWHDMVRRATNPRHLRWADYGGRGIDLDPRWRDYPTFLADMGECPPGYSIERVDNDRGYWPQNCKWIPRGEQSRNRRRSCPPGPRKRKVTT